MSKEEWSMPTQPFDSQILQRLNQVRVEDLYDPNYGKAWIPFAEDVAKMKITQADIQSMTYSQFRALQIIMSMSLKYLSDKNVSSTERIAKLQKKQEILKKNLRKLKEVEEENRQKEQQMDNATDQFQIDLQK